MNIIDAHNNPNSSLRCLVLDLNSFFASCEEQLQPHLRGKPLIVVPVMTDTTCAIAASYPAKKFGIKTGTAVWEAKKMCPGLKIIPARPKLYVEIHHKILAAVDTCLPIHEVLSIDEVSCRLDRLQQDPLSAIRLAHQIKSAIRSQVGEYMTSSVGIAANKLLAKLASDMQKPNGLTVLQAQDMPGAIRHLDIDDICGIGRNMKIRLNDAGINTIDDLWAADAHVMKRVWGGINGIRFHALLHGGEMEEAHTTPTRSMSHQHVLAPAERSIKAATPTIRQLLIRAAQRLRREDFYCKRLSLDIKWQAGGHYYADCNFQETQDTTFLLHILADLWGRAPNQRPLRVGVVLQELVPKEKHQPDLFERRKPAGLMTAIDKLNDKFGRGTITYGTEVVGQTSKIAFQRVPGLEEM